MNPWKEEEAFFPSFDGTQLFYRTWIPHAASNKAIVLLHRGHEHSGRLAGLVEALDLKDFWAFAFDLRGHGRSPGERGYAENYGVWVKDLDSFARFVSKKHGIPYENISIVANSVGAVTASTWVHDYAPRIRSMVLAAPAFRIKLYVPLAIPMLRLLQKIKGKAFIKSYVKSRMLTHDPAEAQRYDEDKLITRNIAVNILLGLYDTSTRILADAGAITMPTLILSSGSDCVVKVAAQKAFFDRMSSPVRGMQVFPDFYHAIFYEKDRTEPIARAREFILKSFKDDVDRSFLRDADKTGFTKEEYDRLTGPATVIRGLCFGLVRLGMRTLGRLSKGIQIGLEAGFDSGTSLDHVYGNKAQGITPLGRLIDRVFLDAIGWKGIRQRKVHIMDSLRHAIDMVNGSGTETRIMDVASGPGRYLLETLKNMPDRNISALLRDYDERNLIAGKRLAEQMAVKNVEFAQGDAFSRESLSSVRPRPNIIVVSGLYELFPANSMVMDSLAGIADVLEDNGYLIYTCQPWHPQVEMIARTLTNREGKPWIMRRRTQAEMDELVRSVGFNKLDMKVDEYGIFTVSVAQKRRAK